MKTRIKIKMLFQSVCWGMFFGCVLSASISTHERTLLSENEHVCYFLLPYQHGSISLQSEGYHDACIWHIRVESAISFDFYIRSHQLMTSSKVADVYVYNHPLSSNKPLAVWRSRDVEWVRSLEGSEFWLTTRSTSEVVVDYVARTTDNLPTCSNVIGADLRFGKIRFLNSTLGSKAQLSCNQGFLLARGSGKLECVVQSGQLVWSGDGSACESTCRHPRPVQHGTHRLKLRVGLRTSNEGVPSESQTRSTVRYSCDNPYQLSGDRVTHCGPDIDGVPTWSSPAPDCQLLDCSRVYSLTARSGAIVSPKSPDGGLLGGSLNCTWEIHSRDLDVEMKVLYADLPLGADSDVTLDISDAESSQQLLRLTGKSKGAQTVRGSASKIQVRYLGPRHDSATYGGFVIEYTLLPRRVRSKRAAGDPSVTATVDSSIGDTVSADDTTVVYSQWTQPALSSQVTMISASLADTSQVTDDVTPSTDVTGDSGSQTGYSKLSSSFQQAVDSADTSGLTSTPLLTTTDEAEDTMSPLVTDASPPYDSTPSPRRSEDLTTASVAAVDEVTSEVWGYSSAADVVDGSSSGTSPATTDSASQELQPSVTSSAQVDDSNDDWKIAVGVIMTILGLGLLALIGYIYYRKKYPVRMIIGREFAKFSNPAYNRSKHAVNLVRDDADDYFVSRSSDSVNPDELNPVNQNILYDNPAFVNEEDEEEADLKFMQKRPWLFTKYSDSENSTSRPLSEITLSSAEFQGNVPKVDSIDSIDAEIDAILGQQQQTPRIKPKRKKLVKTRSQSSSIDTMSGTPSLSDSVDLRQEPPGDTDGDARGSRETSTLTSSEELEKSETDKESNYMKMSKMIFEQPTFEEVCAEARSRSRSLSLERNLPEVRLRSYSVDPFKSARKLSLRGDESSDAAERAATIYESILVRNTDIEVLGRSTTSVSSIISESSIIDESMLDGLPETARERCLSLTSQNSNRHLVTDLDDVSVGANSHRSDIIEDVTSASGSERSGDARSESPVGPESSHEPPNIETHDEASPDQPPSVDYADNEHITESRDEILKEERLVSIATEQRACDETLPNEDSQNEPEIGGDSYIPAARGENDDESQGNLRSVRFESLKEDDEEDEEDSVKLASTRTMSTSSQASSLSVSSGHTETSDSSKDSDDLRSYSFNNNSSSVNDEHETNTSTESEEDTSEENSGVKYDDGISPPSQYSAPLTLLPLPDLPQPPSPLLRHSSADDASSHFRISSDDKPWQTTVSSQLVASSKISESSSDTSDNENRFHNISQLMKIKRQVSVSSEDDDDDTKLTVGDIAQILDDVEDDTKLTVGNMAQILDDVEDDFIESGAITISGLSDRTIDAADQNTFILKNSSSDDDIEV